MRKPDDPIASTDADGEQSFYGRWSRRKRQVRDGALPSDEPAVSAARDIPGPSSGADTGAAVHGPEDAPPAEPVLTDADMPALESLGEDDDFSGFMSPGVSEGLRQQALRQLFMSSKFNVVDGLNDYDDDFRSFEPLGDIITSDMRHQMEVQAERARLKAEEEARALLEAEGPDEVVTGEPERDEQPTAADAAAPYERDISPPADGEPRGAADVAGAADAADGRREGAGDV